jgi:hypothetical protein
VQLVGKRQTGDERRRAGDAEQYLAVHYDLLSESQRQSSQLTWTSLGREGSRGERADKGWEVAGKKNSRKSRKIVQEGICLGDMRRCGKYEEGERLASALLLAVPWLSNILRNQDSQ